MSTLEQQLYFYAYDGLSLISHPNGVTSVLNRTGGWVLGQHDDRQTALYATDRQGSVLRLADSDGCFIRYTVYGWDRHQGASILRFTGQRKETCAGYYMLGDGYRAYTSRLMRFNAPDSVSPFGEGGLNAYCYCGNDPVNNVDPSGHVGLPPNSFLNNGRLFTNRWGLRSAASYALGKKAPMLKTLGVKRGLSEIDHSLRGRIKHAERNQSWQPSDVERLESAAATLQGKANRFELSERYFAGAGYPAEAQASRETRSEILMIKRWVDAKSMKGRDVLTQRDLFDVLPFSQAPKRMLKVRTGL